MASDILKFYTGDIATRQGIKIIHVLGADDKFLEECHDFIQWLFPLTEPSKFNPDAPLLTEEDIQAFKNKVELRETFMQALVRFMRFLGFSIHPNGGHKLLIVQRKDTLDWVTPANHNYLRLTRVLACCTLLGFEDYAKAIYTLLLALKETHAQAIGEVTYEFWRLAVESFTTEDAERTTIMLK